MIEVQQISKYFGAVTAVKNVSFKVEDGETLIILGTSGCGKTTTLRMINRLIEPSAGRISINGALINSVPPEILRRNIGYVLQNTGLFPHYTVAENMAIVPKLLKWPLPRIQSRTRELIYKLHLAEEHLLLYPNQLSGGQQQRVGLARALMADPPVLLMDEPFGALDPITRTNIRQEFLNLDELKRKTILMVTHDVQEAFALGDQICLMNKGQIEQIGTPEELLFQPQTEFVKSFLSEQRLTLELKALKILDAGQAASQNLPSGVSLWETLSLLMQQKKIPVQSSATDAKNKPVYSVRITELLTALQNFRKS